MAQALASPALSTGFPGMANGCKSRTIIRVVHSNAGAVLRRAQTRIKDFRVGLLLIFLVSLGRAPTGSAQELPKQGSQLQPPQKESQKPDAPVRQGPVQQDLGVIPAHAPYRMLSGKERVQWTLWQTLGPQSLLNGALKAGIGTARDEPSEYGPHWDGFGKRAGMRFSGYAASNTIEAGLGSVWGEDPRYVRDSTLPFKRRVTHVILLSFTARNRSGKLVPAYARYIAISGSNFLSNTWRPAEEATRHDALERTGYGVVTEIANNAWIEFWPDLKHFLFRKRPEPDWGVRVIHRRSVLDRNRLQFKVPADEQRTRADELSRRIVLRKIRLVNRVELAEQAQVRAGHLHVDQVVHGHARLRQNFLFAVEQILDFVFDLFRNFAGFRIDANSPGQIQRVSGKNAVAERRLYRPAGELDHFPRSLFRSGSGKSALHRGQNSSRHQNYKTQCHPAIHGSLRKNRESNGSGSIPPSNFPRHSFHGEALRAQSSLHE
jgi:hypothetical protein